MAHQLDSASADRRSERAGTEQPTTFEQNTVGYDDDAGSAGSSDLSELGVKELRALAKERGVSAAGSKAQLVARLS